MTDQQIIDAVQWCYENRSQNVTSLAAWRRLYDLNLTDPGEAKLVMFSLNRLCREGKLARHKHKSGPKHTFYRPAGTPLPAFARHYR